MTIYEETVDALKEMETVASHIKSLGKIMNKTEDAKLKQLLGKVITKLQTSHANPKVKGKSTPGNLYNVKDLHIESLIKYCENIIPTKRPEWQILAERNGWAPKT
ncbi:MULTISPECIES: hypothetical protein [unclassified Halomonas]|uniref:hypothetical protein n=1 Tax=unclassified Halomonas TaxID=2609666 RepID=UPI0005FC5739|nr:MULTISPECIES: hypothetical protein [unclassified Halomonas]CEP34823.1 Putative uncharacterized protein [Halomonas sp. R57-5]